LPAEDGTPCPLAQSARARREATRARNAALVDDVVVDVLIAVGCCRIFLLFFFTDSLRRHLKRALSRACFGAWGSWWCWGEGEGQTSQGAWGGGGAKGEVKREVFCSTEWSTINQLRALRNRA